MTAIGSFAADTVIRELKEAGYRVIGSDIYDPKWVAASQDVEAFYQAPLAKDEKKYIDFIKDIVAKEHVTRIVPLIDVEVDVLNRHRAEIETDAVRICMSDEEVITTLRDKLLMTKLVAGTLYSSRTGMPFSRKDLEPSSKVSTMLFSGSSNLPST